MYVCICNGITEDMIEKVASVSKSEKEILSRLGIGNSCGICVLEAVSKINTQLKSGKNQKSQTNNSQVNLKN